MQKRTKILLLALAVFLVLVTSAATLTLWRSPHLARKLLSWRPAEKKEAADSANLSPAITKSFPLEVTLIKPNTENVLEVRQITVTFNKPMVALGDFEKLAEGFPFQVEPSVPCHLRWLNRLTLSCELDQSLPGSNAYKVTVGQGIKAYDGTVLEKSTTAEFSTEMWRVVNHVNDWQEPDLPILVLAFNQPMDLQSLLENSSSNCGELLISSFSEEVAAKYTYFDRSRAYEYRYKKNIGLARDCELKISEKARSQMGPVNGKAFSMKFKTYPEFFIKGVTCYDHKESGPSKTDIAIGGCDPASGVDIAFSAPVYAKDLARQIDVNPFFGWTQGGENSPEYFEQNPHYMLADMYLNGPMKPSSEHRIVFKDIKDRFGRPLTQTKNIVVKTVDYAPSLVAAEGYGVLELKGPRQFPYEAVNIKGFPVDFFQTRDAAQLNDWYGASGDDYDGRRCPPGLNQAKTLRLDTGLQLNERLGLPLEIKKIAPDFTYGLIAMRLKNFDYIGNGYKPHPFERCFKLVVTDLGIMAKVGFFSSGVWVHSLETGLPVPQTAVALYDGAKELAHGITDDNGFAALPGAGEWDPDREMQNAWGNHRLYVVAKSPQDFSVLPFSAGARGIQTWEFNELNPGNYFYEEPLTKSANHIVHAISDRPLYQPGQEVQLKIFARQWEPRHFGLKPDEEMEITVRDSLGKDSFQQTLKLSAFGTAHATFTVDPGAPLGEFSINAKIGKWERQIGQFSVQEFVLPAFKVEVKSPAESYRVDDTAHFETRATYHFGGALANTKGEYVATFRESRWQPKKNSWKKYVFDNPVALNLVGYEQTRSWQTFQLLSGEVKTDDHGQAQTDVVLPLNQLKSYGFLDFEAKFADDRGKNISDHHDVEVLFSEVQLGMRTPEWTYEATEKIIPEIMVLNSKEEPLPNQEIRLKLVHRTYKTVRTKGAGNYFSYETFTEDTVIDECRTLSGLQARGCALQPKAAGSHFILAETQDKKGRLAQSSMHVYVTGKEYIGWYRENHDRIELVPEQAEYELGQTLRVLVKNPYEKVNAIFTLERFGILLQFRKMLTQGAEIIEIPLKDPDYAPGFNLSVQLIQGRTGDKIENNIDLGKPSFKMGLTQVKVKNPETILNITAKTDKREYEPQNEVKVDVDVKSISGARESELSVAVVDERILQLAGAYQSKYDLHSKFYRVPGADVLTSQMLTYLIGRRHFGKKGAPTGGDGLSEGVAIRKDFFPIAYWNPALLTDALGHAKFSFKTPDNLTTWRLLVVAVDKGHRFGYGDASFVTSKKVMLEPALPAFLTEGDEVNARLSVFNRTGKSANMTLELKVEGVDLLSPAKKNVLVANDKKAQVEWKLKAPVDSKKAVLIAKAVAPPYSDGAQYTLPIRPFVSYETFATYGSTTKQQVEEPIAIPQGIRTDLGGLELILSSSLISHLDDVFRYVFDYPYTCWEQRMVKALMLNHFANLKNYLNLEQLKDYANKDSAKEIQDLLAMMPNYQFSNGAMAYWKPHAETIDPYLSAFTALGLLWLEQSKVAVPKVPKEKLLNYVMGLLDGRYGFPSYYTPQSRATVLAMSTYVMTMAGENTASHINKAFEDRQHLSLFGKSFLWMASHRQGGNAAISDKLKNEIYSTANMTSGDIQFQEVHDDGWIRILHSTTRTNCSLLSAMLEAESNGPFVENLVRWVIGTRKANRWNNTQENLYCLNAVTQYARIYETNAPHFTAKGHVMQKPLAPLTFSSFRDVPQTKKFSFTPELVGKSTSFALQKEGPGRLYYTARLRVAYEKVRTDAVNSGMQIERHYFLKGPTGKWTELSSEAQIKRADLVRVQLKIKIPATRYQVAIDDSLPAGLEPLNTALSGTSASDAGGQGDNTSGSYYWNEDDFWLGIYMGGGFYHREVRLHGMQYFADFIEPGDYELNYIAQAIATGSFQVNPSLIEQMYAPEVYGKSVPAHFVIGEN